MGRKTRKILLFTFVLTVVGIVFAATPHKDTWDVPGDLAGWHPNTIGYNEVTVMDSGGNPGGYLYSYSTAFSGLLYYAGAATEKEEFTGDLSIASLIQISFDVKVMEGVAGFEGVWLGIRSNVQGMPSWDYQLIPWPSTNGWVNYTITFDPSWTDSEASSEGWVCHNAPSFSESMSDVLRVDIYFVGNNPISVGFDNFAIAFVDIHVPSVYPTIQAAIDAASDGDTVLVADGTYTGPGNRDLDFQGKAITVKSENGPDNCIINCEASGRGFNFHNSEGEESVVSGFTISNAVSVLGGGILCEDSSPTITNCIISGNLCYDRGGGIYCLNSSPAITNCIINGNGDFNTNRGGGIYCLNSSPIINSCKIYDNSSDNRGGGIYCEDSSPTITNCAIFANSADQLGGGIYCENSSPTITNCTIYGNRNRVIGIAGGIICIENSSPFISNCIFYENSGYGGHEEILVYDSTPHIIYSLINPRYYGEGNIYCDPHFVSANIFSDPSEWDLHLLAYSACIDAGTDTVELPDSDFDGNKRILDGNGDGIHIVDMGAYEYVPINTPSGQLISVTPAPGITVTFETVEVAGHTSCEISPYNPGPAQQGILFLGNYYNIHTTASYMGQITITLNYDETDIPAGKTEYDLRIFHLEGTSWVDRTSSIDTVQNTISAIVPSLSWFTLGVPNQPPIANAGTDIEAEQTSEWGANVQLNGSGSSDPDGDLLSFEWGWNGNTASGVSPIITLPPGLTSVTLTVSDGYLSDSDTVDVLIVDTTPPQVNITFPTTDLAVQDGITLGAVAVDVNVIADVYFYIRVRGGASCGFEDLPGEYNSGTGEWQCDFDTTQLEDGYYEVVAKAIDSSGKEGWSDAVPFSIRNWAVLVLLPNTESNKAGRTMPIKFSLHISAAVDPAQPFVFSRHIEVKVFEEESGELLQTSHYGLGSRDYRIDLEAEHYIVNFKTSKTPAKYVVRVYKIGTDFEIDHFTFETVK